MKRSKTRFHRLQQFYSLLTTHSYWYNRAQSKALELQLNDLLSRRDYDIVLSEFAAMGHFDLDTDAIRILDAHNVEYDNFRRMSLLEWSAVRRKFYEREHKRSFQEEMSIFNKQTAVFATSERDSEIIRENSSGVSHFVIPNGVDTGYFKPNASATEPFSMVFTGAMSYVPNVDGMIFFLKKIFPLVKRVIPEAKIYIVGGNPPPFLTRYRSDSVIITGYVDDVRPFIDRAGVYVVPLKMGSGTRLKVMEALAMKKPIVSTSIGCEGIDVKNEEHLFIRDEADTFASAVIQLMEDSRQQMKFSNNGYDLVKNKYDWKVIGDTIEESLDALQKETYPV
ncbi:MAG: glycosyltransferase family 4 protein [Balneolaceae bacterium]